MQTTIIKGAFLCVAIFLTHAIHYNWGKFHIITANGNKHGINFTVIHQICCFFYLGLFAGSITVYIIAAINIPLIFQPCFFSRYGISFFIFKAVHLTSTWL